MGSASSERFGRFQEISFQLVVALEAAGSNPVIHPTQKTRLRSADAFNDRGLKSFRVARAAQLEIAFEGRRFWRPRDRSSLLPCATKLSLVLMP